MQNAPIFLSLLRSGLVSLRKYRICDTEYAHEIYQKITLFDCKLPVHVSTGNILTGTRKVFVRRASCCANTCPSQLPSLRFRIGRTTNMRKGSGKYYNGYIRISVEETGKERIYIFFIYCIYE